MPDWSRRHVLQTVATTGTVSLVGCSGETSVSNSVPPDRGEPVSDVDVTFARDGDGSRLFTVGEETDDRPGGTEVLTDPADRERVSFRSTPAAAELEAFVQATNLDSAAVYLLARPIGACYRANLIGIYREEDEVTAEFCEELRAADVACSADVEETVGIAARFPFAGDSIQSYGSRWGGDCGRRAILAREGGEGR